jgi:hypothetical protein
MLDPWIIEEIRRREDEERRQREDRERPTLEAPRPMPGYAPEYVPEREEEAEERGIAIVDFRVF